MLKEFVTPDSKKLVLYLLLVIVLVFETLIIRSVYKKDYTVDFLLSIYNTFFNEIEYVNFFMISFAYYIIVLVVLYIVSCLIVFILGRIRE